MTRRYCFLKAGHAGRCRLVTRAVHRRKWGAPIERGITPSEPPCIRPLMRRVERAVREGRLGGGDA